MQVQRKLTSSECTETRPYRRHCQRRAFNLQNTHSTAYSSSPLPLLSLWLSFFPGRSSYFIISSSTSMVLGQHRAHLIVNTIKGVLSLVFIGSTLACYQIFTLHGLRSSPSKASKDQQTLTAHQLQLLGLKPKAYQVASSEPSKNPPKSKPRSKPPSGPPLVPLHQFTMTSAKCSSFGSSNDKLNTGGGGGTKMRLVTSPSKSLSPPTSLYLVPGGVGVSSLASSQHHSPSLDSVVSTPW